DKTRWYVKSTSHRTATTKEILWNSVWDFDEKSGLGWQMELCHRCMQVQLQNLAGAENLRLENGSFAQFWQRVLPAKTGRVQLPLQILEMMEMETSQQWTLSQKWSIVDHSAV
ncbi:hypothetical protein ABG768_019081, partial [Culter alburnus]